MYLTSHRVRTDRGNEGINTYLYEQGEIIDDLEAALEKIAQDAGLLRAAACTVPPGNNPVLSYLDIVADDGVSIEDLDTARKTVWTALSNEPHSIPLQIKAGRVLVQFGCTIGQMKSRHHLRDYGELWERALFVLQTKPVPPWMEGKPIMIEVWQEGNMRVYQPSAESIARLRLRHGPRWQSKRLTIDVMDKLDLERYHGDLSPEAASTLTDLSLNELAAFGGVKVHLRGRPDQVLFAWPPVTG